MRRPFGWQLPVLLLLLVARAAGAQVPGPTQSSQPPGTPSGASATPANAGETPPAPTTSREQVIVTAPPPPNQGLPVLRPDEFSSCMAPAGMDLENGQAAEFYEQTVICEQQLNYEKHVVVEACINRDGKTALPRVIQACTESLDRRIFEGNARFFLFGNRAAAYLAQGDKQHALDDFNEAVRLAPRTAGVYYNRSVFYTVQSDDDAALKDLDTAIGIDSRFVPALRQRAKIRQARANFSGALADYSEAIRLQPKSAALWSERGYVSLRQKDNEGAVRDEAQAIQLDPKLARAYYLRGVAFGYLGNSANAVSDLQTAVNLDPSLAHYVTIKGKTVSLGLPPL